ncbi:MAG: hypothetical protein ACRED4_03455, partial [Brevundimonas sp.]
MATDKPAAIPPDNTFCVKRFITDLRMKGGSTALLQSEAKKENRKPTNAAHAGTGGAGTGRMPVAPARLRKSEKCGVPTSGTVERRQPDVL